MKASKKFLLSVTATALISLTDPCEAMWKRGATAPDAAKGERPSTSAARLKDIRVPAVPTDKVSAQVEKAKADRVAADDAKKSENLARATVREAPQLSVMVTDEDTAAPKRAAADEASTDDDDDYNHCYDYNPKLSTSSGGLGLIGF